MNISPLFLRKVKFVVPWCIQQWWWRCNNTFVILIWRLKHWLPQVVTYSYINDLLFIDPRKMFSLYSTKFYAEKKKVFFHMTYSTREEMCYKLFVIEEYNTLLFCLNHKSFVLLILQYVAIFPKNIVNEIFICKWFFVNVA